MSGPQNPGRRDFLKATGVAAAALSARSWSSIAAGDSVADRLRVAVIGTGVRGKYLIGNLPPTVQVTAICDCAAARIAETLEPRTGPFKDVLASFLKRDASVCRTYQDYRVLLDREDLDAVIIATPDHHHAQAALLALDAGLDVYLEKPLALTIHEGRMIANKVKKTGQILQVGSQQRTMEVNRFGCEFVRNGGIGKVRRVELPNYPGPIASPDYPSEPVPDGLDWNLFLGPAPRRPHNEMLWVKDEFRVDKLLWRGWDLFRDYSGHIMTNWGGHSVDMMQYALDTDLTGPVFVEAFKPKSVNDAYLDWSHKTPAPSGTNDRRFWPVCMRYRKGIEAVFLGPNAPVRIYGDRGVVRIRRNHFEVDPPELVTDYPFDDLADEWNGRGHVARPHLQNWLDCMRSRKQPNAPAEVGHRTATICHLANIAREIAMPLQWDPNREQFVDSKAANNLLNRPRRAEFGLP